MLFNKKRNKNYGINMMDTNSTGNAERSKFVRACLVHVPFDGWTRRSLELAAEDCGMTSSDISRILPQGVIQAIEIYANLADEDMVSAFNAKMMGAEDSLKGMTAKIKFMIIARLEQALPHKEVVRKTIKHLCNPRNFQLSQRILYKTIDRIWREAGDQSTDFNFYTKRGLLGATYSSTLLYFLSDDSGLIDNTSAFLDRRLREISFIPKVTKPLEKRAKFMFSGVGSVFSSLAKNISQQMAKRG